MNQITYKKGYKYQLYEDYVVTITIFPKNDVETRYIFLTKDGLLNIKKGYAWDGPSGPTLDVKSFMRGALIHDALYQLMRNEKLNHNIHRDPADRLLQFMCKEDGMTRLGAWLVYQGVRLGGGPAADPSNRKPEIRAPGTNKNLARETS